MEFNGKLNCPVQKILTLSNIFKAGIHHIIVYDLTLTFNINLKHLA